MSEYFFEMRDSKQSVGYRRCEADDLESAVAQVNSKKWRVLDPNAPLMRIGFIPYDIITEDRSTMKLAGKRKEGYVLAHDEKQAGTILWASGCALSEVIETSVNYTPISGEDSVEDEANETHEEAENND